MLVREDPVTGAGELEGVQAINRLRSESSRLATNHCSCPIHRAL